MKSSRYLLLDERFRKMSTGAYVKLLQDVVFLDAFD
jgi:hypothetical protein